MTKRSAIEDPANVARERDSYRAEVVKLSRELAEVKRQRRELKAEVKRQREELRASSRQVRETA